ncbi:MAG: HAMP domain-containing protein [Clostridia bacterium]|nr:HAMP domain-containing protein [Clostridia bacterium]
MFVLAFGILQQVTMVRTYKRQAERDVSEKGAIIRTCVLTEPPKEFGGNFSGYLRFLSNYYDVKIFLLDQEGEVLFPQEHNFDPSAPEIEQQYDFTDEVQTLIRKMQEEGESTVVYENQKEYVYGSKISMFGGDAESYLYVSKSLTFIQTATSSIGERMTYIAIFILILSFAISSALSGWLTRPINEMTEQARELAKGNFDVDFRGTDYGQEMVELAETLNYARDELSKTDKMQKDLIANVSHDFKTPLTMIKGYASMIIEISGDNPEKRAKHAQVIIDEADRLAGLVSDVLDLSKIQSGIEQMETRALDMSTYVEEVLDRFAYLQETQGYQFITEIEPDLYTRADELKIGQVLYNLIGNAVNYTGEDKTVTVRLKRTGKNCFRFSVTDTGTGIKPEELSAVWDRYYRSSEMHKRPVKGMGLGLSIVKSVLERHGFYFGIDTEWGKGSTFFVDFPLLEEE